MPKCPRCGSTAQVKFASEEVKKDRFDSRSLKLITYYKCGCGTAFQVIAFYSRSYDTPELIKEESIHV